jgi:beta-lactamase regulating signal transducer with metallopeptidase domain
MNKKFRLLQDAREVYPKKPSDKLMGAIFLSMGLRLAISVAVIWIARVIIFMPRVALWAHVFWIIVLIATMVYIGYFLYTFHLYLQDNMKDIIERRKKELQKHQQAAAKNDHKTKKDDA